MKKWAKISNGRLPCVRLQIFLWRYSVGVLQKESVYSPMCPHTAYWYSDRSIYLFHPHPLKFLYSRRITEWVKQRNMSGAGRALMDTTRPFPGSRGISSPSVNTVRGWNKSGCRKWSVTAIFIRSINDVWAAAVTARVTYLILCVNNQALWHRKECPPPNATKFSYELSWFTSWLWR